MAPGPQHDSRPARFGSWQTTHTPEDDNEISRQPVHGQARLPQRRSVSGHVRPLRGRPRRILGGAGGHFPGLGPGLGDGIRSGSSGRKGALVRRRRAQCLLQLHRPAPAGQGRPDSHHLGGGRPRRRCQGNLSATARCGLQTCQRAALTRRVQGRPGVHLHAHDSRSSLCDARLRPHRRRSFRRFRRFLPPIPQRPDSRLRLSNGHHRRSGCTRRPYRTAQAQYRNGAGRLPQRAYRGDRETHRRGSALGRRPGCLVPRSHRRAVCRLRPGTHGRRGSPVHSVHLRIHRPAERGAARHRGLSPLRGDDAQVRLRLPRRRHLLVHRRRRLDHRSFLHRLRAAGQRRHHAHVRGRAHLAGRVALLAGGGQARREHLLHRTDRHPPAHGPGRRIRGLHRACFAATSGHGRRADQSRSLGVVSPRGGRPPLPHCRYLVADGNRRHHDNAAAGRDDPEARQRDAAVLRGAPRPGRHRRQGNRRNRSVRQPGDHHILARDRSAPSTAITSA